MLISSALAYLIRAAGCNNKASSISVNPIHAESNLQFKKSAFKQQAPRVHVSTPRFCKCQQAAGPPPAERGLTGMLSIKLSEVVSMQSHSQSHVDKRCNSHQLLQSSWLYHRVLLLLQKVLGCCTFTAPLFCLCRCTILTKSHICLKKQQPNKSELDSPALSCCRTCRFQRSQGYTRWLSVCISLWLARSVCRRSGCRLQGYH